MEFSKPSTSLGTGITAQETDVTSTNLCKDFEHNKISLHLSGYEVAQKIK
jgi:hypothetical protein